MLITRISPLTGKTNSLELNVTEAQFRNWENGQMLQDAFRNLEADEREFIKSGYLPGEFDLLFSENKTILSSDKSVMFEAIEKHFDNSKKQFEQLPPHIQKRIMDNPPIIIDSFPPLPKEWKILEEDPVQVAGEREAADNEWVEESTLKKDKVEKVYSPPSSKIYFTSNISYHKFHKVRPVYKYLNSNIYLAGGSLRTVLKCAAEDVNDFDLFFKTLAEVQPLRDKLESDGWEQTYECPDGFLYSYRRGKHKIQLICEVEYDSIYTLLNSFDVSACLYGWHDGTLYFAREAVRSVFTKNLRVNNVTFPVATLKRIVKYAQKGYSVSDAAEDFCRKVNTKTFDGTDWRRYID